jgi:hypothetical protein
MSIFNHFQHLSLSQDQQNALSQLERVLHSKEKVFMLKGYAGSGKTTILAGFVDYLKKNQKQVALMAPTGRAAKVLQERTGHDAFTIHKTIYSYEALVTEEENESFFYYFKLKENTSPMNKIYIVDEASMISDVKNDAEFFRFGSGKLLSDLFSFTRINELYVDAKLIFVGDPCQLPPISENTSKAFDSNYLLENFRLQSTEVEMKEVLRQEAASGISQSAITIRKSITSNVFNQFKIKPNGIDLQETSFHELLNNWESEKGTKIVIASKNKTCKELNRVIRERLFGNGNIPIRPGDWIIVGANNYQKNILNGEFGVVNEVSDQLIIRTVPLSGKSPVKLVWRHVTLIIPEGNGNKIIQGYVLENFLEGENTLKSEETQALFVDFTKRFQHLKLKSEEFKQKIMEDEFFNCIQVKYGYAVTCHKAQGGEWDNVFTVWDQDNTANFNYFTDKQKPIGKTNKDFFRWAYTAITRASKRLITINPPSFNPYSGMTLVEIEIQNSLKGLKGINQNEIEIEMNQTIFERMVKFGLDTQPIQIQNHFITVLEAIKKGEIQIVNWQRLGFEIRYQFQRNQSIAVFRTYINGHNEFTLPLSIMPKFSTDEVLNRLLETILSNLPLVQVKRNTVETILTQIEFDMETESKFPFTKKLFDDIFPLLEKEMVRVDEIKHLNYKERYLFSRNTEKLGVDFEYNLDGFWGRIVVLPKETNSKPLMEDLKKVIENLKIK